jgi:hypothetical protein
VRWTTHRSGRMPKVIGVSAESNGPINVVHVVTTLHFVLAMIIRALREASEVQASQILHIAKGFRTHFQMTGEHVLAAVMGSSVVVASDGS